MKIREIIIALLALCIQIVIIGILWALPVMLLWNWLMPEIFGLIQITFWQALGLSLLSSFLFKGSSSKDN